MARLNIEIFEKKKREKNKKSMQNHLRELLKRRGSLMFYRRKVYGCDLTWNFVSGWYWHEIFFFFLFLAFISVWSRNVFQWNTFRDHSNVCLASNFRKLRISPICTRSMSILRVLGKEFYSAVVKYFINASITSVLLLNIYFFGSPVQRIRKIPANVGVQLKDS